MRLEQGTRSCTQHDVMLEGNGRLESLIDM